VVDDKASDYPCSGAFPRVDPGEGPNYNIDEPWIGYRLRSGEILWATRLPQFGLEEAGPSSTSIELAGLSLDCPGSLLQRQPLPYDLFMTYICQSYGSRTDCSCELR
jgi:hypothetical protein